MLRSLFKTRFFSLITFKIYKSIKYQLSNHCFVFSSSPKSLGKKRGKHLSFGTFDSVFHRFFEYYYIRVLSFSPLLLMYVLFDDISECWSVHCQFDRKVKYSLVLYVDNINWANTLLVIRS